MIKLTSENFKSEVLDYSGISLVSFWGDVCLQCKLMEEKLSKVRDNNKSVKVCSANVIDNTHETTEYDILALPTLILFKGGKKVKTAVGNVDLSIIEEMLKSIR